MKKPPVYSIHLAIIFLICAFICACFFVVFLIQKQVAAIITGILFLFFLLGGIVLLVFGINRRKNRVLGKYGERKIIVEYMENIIEVYNFSAALSSVNHITLIINNIVVDRYDGIANSVLKGKIKTLDGEKTITLKSNNFIGNLKLFCEDTLLAKKFMPLG